MLGKFLKSLGKLPRPAMVGLAMACGSVSAMGQDFLDESEYDAPAVCVACPSGPGTLFSWNACWPNFAPTAPLDEPLVTDRPDFTESPCTVGKGVLQVELGYTYTYDAEGIETAKYHSAPEALFRLGMFVDWFEARLAYNAADNRTSGLGGIDGVSGSEDLYLGVKLALANQCGVLPQLGILLQTTAPTGSSGLTAGEWLPGFNFVYAWDVTEKFSIGGGSQANRSIDDIGQFYVEVAQSITTGYEFNDQWEGFAEWYAFFPAGADGPGTQVEHYFDTGLTYLVNDNLQLDARVGLGLNAAADDYFVGAGFSKRF